MTDNWWCNRQWAVRNDGPLSAILSKGDTLLLEPNTTEGNPLFFWIRFENKNSQHAGYWRARYVYPVGANPPSIKLQADWDDSRPPDAQKDGVNSHYNTIVRQVRALADDPYTARLEGHITAGNHVEIIRLFFFKGAQPCGKDWFVIDALQLNEVPVNGETGERRTREDGTAHGDPK